MSTHPFSKPKTKELTQLTSYSRQMARNLACHLKKMTYIMTYIIKHKN